MRHHDVMWPSVGGHSKLISLPWVVVNCKSCKEMGRLVCEFQNQITGEELVRLVNFWFQSRKSIMAWEQRLLFASLYVFLSVSSSLVSVCLVCSPLWLFIAATGSLSSLSQVPLLKCLIPVFVRSNSSYSFLTLSSFLAVILASSSLLLHPLLLSFLAPRSIFPLWASYSHLVLLT